MRHLWSLVAGILAAPLAWLLLAIGQSGSRRTVAGWEQDGFFDTGQLVGPVIFLAVAGLLLGVLGTLRWSPAGPVAAGLLLILPTVFMFGNPLRTLEFFSYDQDRRLLWQDFRPWLPVENGTLLVLGALLLVAVASVQRWRKWPVLPAPVPPATDEQVVDGVTALGQRSGQSPMSDDEILAAAAAIDEQSGQTPGTQGGQPAAGGPSDGPQAAGEPPDERPPADQPGQGDQSAASGRHHTESRDPATGATSADVPTDEQRRPESGS